MSSENKDEMERPSTSTSSSKTDSWRAMESYPVANSCASVKLIGVEEEPTESPSESPSESDLSNLETKVRVVNPKLFSGGYKKTKGELTLDDLPRIEDLRITVPEKEPIFAIGAVKKIIDSLVIVHSLDLKAALDEDSVLLLEDRSPIGKIHETFGPVPQPYYSVRFNSGDDVKEKGIILGTLAYFAPQCAELTKYVFLSQLEKMKGSDASWMDDNEPPPEALDYSDDEAEQNANRDRRKKERMERLQQQRPDDDNVEKSTTDEDDEADEADDEAKERRRVRMEAKQRKWEERKERRRQLDGGRGGGRRFQARGGGRNGGDGGGNDGGGRGDGNDDGHYQRQNRADSPDSFGRGRGRGRGGSLGGGGGGSGLNANSTRGTGFFSPKTCTCTCTCTPEIRPLLPLRPPPASSTSTGNGIA